MMLLSNLHIAGPPASYLIIRPYNKTKSPGTDFAYID